MALARPWSAVILRYHSVQSDPTAEDNPVFRGIVHTTADFEDHMKLLAARFSPVSIDNIGKYFEGSQKLPKRSVVVTFDDGYLDNYEWAAPILRRCGIPAAFYVTVSPTADGKSLWFSRTRYAFEAASARAWKHPATGEEWPLSLPEERFRAFKIAGKYCASLAGERQNQAVRDIENSLGSRAFPYEGKLMMTWEQLCDLESQGHIVGSHTMSHPNVAHIPSNQAEYELAESKRILESHLGHPVRHFSYPHPALNPHWTETTTRQLREIGYSTAVTCEQGPVERTCDSLCLPRIAAPDNVERLKWILETNMLGLRFR
jgi:peptidoglycan/xylan/chitin deacetylase (PgdA/CDA1 family)